MEEKKLDYRYKLIIGLLIICIIGVIIAYLVSDKFAVNTSDDNSQIEETTDTKLICEYSELKNPNNLTEDEKIDLIDFLSKTNPEMEIDVDTVKIDLIEKYVYSIEYEYVKKEGSYALKDMVWKKNGFWENYGAGSDFLPEEYEQVHLNICTSCSDEC